MAGTALPQSVSRCHRGRHEQPEDHLGSIDWGLLGTSQAARTVEERVDGVYVNTASCSKAG